MLHPLRDPDLWLRYLRCPTTCNSLSDFGFFFSPALRRALSLAAAFADDGDTEAMPCGLLAWRIIPSFSFIVTCLLRLVVGTTSGLPVYEINDDEASHQTYIMFGLRSSTH